MAIFLLSGDGADEMGIMVLDETGLFGSSINLNFEAPEAWEQNYNMIDGCANNLPKPRIINGRESVLDKLRIRRMAREKQKSSQEQSADMERNRK